MPKRMIEDAGFARHAARLRAGGDEWCDILEAAMSPEEARDRFLDALDEWEAGLREDGLDLNRTDVWLALESIRILRDLMSPVNERLAGFSTIGTLWQLVHGHLEERDVSKGFIEEFVHLFEAVAGRTDISAGWIGIRPGSDRDLESLPLSGRKAGIARSRVLDEMAEAAFDRIDAYVTGLDERLIARRERNRMRILEALGGQDTDWEDAMWQWEHVFRGEQGARKLGKIAVLSRRELAALLLASSHRIPWAITPYYLSLFDLSSASGARDGQIRAQVLPSLENVRGIAKLRAQGKRRLDFMRERDTSPVEHVTRRYAGIAILKVTDTCPQICTYCQRDWEIADPGMPRQSISLDTLEPAFRWFETHDRISEVLITGGDPLSYRDATLRSILERVAAIPHVMSIRIGTRYPVTMPMRITESLADMLGVFIEPGRRNLSLVTHIEGVREITPDLVQAVTRLRSAGISVYNQQVFTLHTSRRFQTAALRVALRKIGIDPYYTFYAKGKPEHADQLVPVARILQERKEETRLLPGLLRTDEPVFNVPGLGKNHLRARQDREWIAIRPDGRRVYLFHPWEKAVAPASPWMYADVSIDDYLARLEALGEDPEDYESIWYYS